MQQSSTAGDFTILSLLPPCPLPGMECTTTTKGMVTGGHLPIPVASKSTKLSHEVTNMAIKLKTLSKLTRQLKMEKDEKKIEAELGFFGEGLLFSGAMFRNQEV